MDLATYVNVAHSVKAILPLLPTKTRQKLFFMRRDDPESMHLGRKEFLKFSMRMVPFFIFCFSFLCERQSLENSVQCFCLDTRPGFSGLQYRSKSHSGYLFVRRMDEFKAVAPFLSSPTASESFIGPLFFNEGWQWSCFSFLPRSALYELCIDEDILSIH